MVKVSCTTSMCSPPHQSVSLSRAVKVRSSGTDCSRGQLWTRQPAVRRSTQSAWNLETAASEQDRQLELFGPTPRSTESTSRHDASRYQSNCAVLNLTLSRSSSNQTVKLRSRTSDVQVDLAILSRALASTSRKRAIITWPTQPFEALKHNYVYLQNRYKKLVYRQHVALCTA